MRPHDLSPSSHAGSGGLHPVLHLGLWLAIVFVAAAVGAFGSRDAPVFYAQLSRPEWSPPAGIFGPVWTVLYTMMAVAAWLVARAPGRHPRAMVLFGLQLGANVLWSWFFFAWRNGPLAFADAVLMALLIVANIVAFWRVRPLAGALLLPYLAWVSFAAVLTWVVWQRNPGLL